MLSIARPRRPQEAESLLSVARREVDILSKATFSFFLGSNFASMSPMIDKSRFAVLFVAECAKLLERITGRREAESFLRLVFHEVGKRIEHGFNQGPSNGKPTSDEIMQNLLTITSDLGAAFAVRSKSEDKILLSSTRCPFGTESVGCQSICMWSSALWGGTLARHLGYARVSIDKSIAAGDEQCELTISLRPTSSGKREREVEYFSEDALAP